MGYVRITFRCYLVVLHGLHLPLSALGAVVINGHLVSGVSGITVKIDPPSGLSSEDDPFLRRWAAFSADIRLRLSGGTGRNSPVGVRLVVAAKTYRQARNTKSDYSDKPCDT